MPVASVYLISCFGVSLMSCFAVSLSKSFKRYVRSEYGLKLVSKLWSKVPFCNGQSKASLRSWQTFPDVKLQFAISAIIGASIPMLDLSGLVLIRSSSQLLLGVSATSFLTSS